MAKKQQTQKRRVAAANQMARQQAAAAKAARRKQLIVGGVVGFLALALIAPLTAGLIGSDDPEPPPVTTTTLVDLPWVSAENAGATITGPTPCPATDGSAERTTEFEQAPPICIEAGALYDMTVETSAGSFSVPIDTNLDATAANLTAVLGWYHAYEQTPVAAAGGLMLIGGAGDPGFTIPLDPPTDSADELYPVGSVVALPSIDNSGITGTLVVVLNEGGATVIRTDPRYIPVGMIDDLSDHQLVNDAAEVEGFLLIDSVSVELAG